MKTGLGMVAVKDIPAGIFIIETCSCMSRDVVKLSGPSIVKSCPGQLGPSGNRSVLGPFRFINHDCNPNAQVRARFAAERNATDKRNMPDKSDKRLLRIRDDNAIRDKSRTGNHSKVPRRRVFRKELFLLFVHRLFYENID